MEYRIYIEGSLVNICQSDFVFINNFNCYKKQFKTKKVTYTYKKIVKDKESEIWLKSI